MELPDLSILSLSFRLQAQASVMLPPFLGSTLRGAFGAALQRVFCFVPHETTDDCWFREACPYQYIFESKNLGVIPKNELHAHLKGQKEFPHPFILLAPDPVKKRQTKISATERREKDFNDDFQFSHFAAGEVLDFSIILIGKAIRHWAHVLTAVRLFAEEGLGEENKRTAFKLVEAFTHDSQGVSLRVFSGEDARLSTRDVAPIKLAWIANLRVQILKEELRGRGQDESRLQIEFISPTSRRILLNEGKKITFFDLLKKIIERLEHLASLHAEPVQKIDYRPLLAEAENVRTIAESLQFYRYRQRSNRQERGIPRDVFLGEAVFGGEELNEFLPFLAAGELLNVGSTTAAGLGKFIIKC